MKEKLNSKLIEMMSVTKLKDAILRTGIAEPAILDNDKTPSWDGEIRLYKSQGAFSKSDLKGTIPVQVKGTCVENFSKGKATFQVNVSDLSNYQKSHGTMFFLVQMKDFDQYKIYYAALLPFDLREKLNEAKGQITKSIKLDLFPHKYVDGMAQIFAEFLMDQEKQGKLLPTVWSMQDLESRAIDIDHFEVSMSAVGVQSEDDLAKELLSKPRFVYAKPKGLDAVFAVDKIWPKRIAVEKNIAVIVNGALLFDHISIVRDQRNDPIIQIGPSIQLIKESGGVRLTYARQGMLRDEIKSLRLFAAVMQHEEITLGGKAFPTDGIVVPEEDIKECLLQLSWLEAAAKALDALHVKNDLDVSALSDEDRQRLDMLINGIYEKKPVHLNVAGNTIGKLSIGNLKVLLCAETNPVGDGFLISNFFAQRQMTASFNTSEQEIDVPISPYVMTTAETLQEFDNANTLLKGVKRGSDTLGI